MDVTTISYILQDKCQLIKAQPVLAGVSGGADSMALLHLLWQAGYRVTAAHLDHMLRENSAGDAAFVRDFCREREIPFVEGRADVAEYCRGNNCSVEEGAREQRYRFLYDSCLSLECAAVAVGHHADDQVETVLMHFLRGSGLDGLKGMEYRTILPGFSDKVALVRPLLDLTHDDLLEYCKGHNIPYIQDESNTDITFFRNRLRHELIPFLQTYNPAISRTILRTARALQADHECLEALVAQAWQECVLETGEEYIRLDLMQLRGFPPGKRWNILRKAVRQVHPQIRDFDQEALLRMDRLVTGRPLHGRVELTNHLEARTSGHELLICWEDFFEWSTDYPQLENELELAGSDETYQLPNGWRLHVLWLEAAFLDGETLRSATRYQAWLDAATLADTVRIRPFQQGDRIDPLGANGHHSRVSDLFINKGIPRTVRATYPVVCDGEKLVWVPYLTISDGCKVTPSTGKVLSLNFERPMA